VAVVRKKKEERRINSFLFSPFASHHKIVAIYIEDGGNVTEDDAYSVVDSNAATLYGGGIYVSENSVLVFKTGPFLCLSIF
jgi:hypothetical protein